MEQENWQHNADRTKGYFHPDSRLGVAALSLARGGGSQFLKHMLFLATDHIGADGAILLAHRDNRCDILCSVGLPLSADVEIDRGQYEALLKSSGKLLKDQRRNRSDMRWTFVHAAPYWQSFLPIKLVVQLQDVKIFSVFGIYRPNATLTMRESPPFWQIDCSS